MNTSDTRRHPRRMLSSGFTLAVIIGGTIGLGILRTPGEVAAVVPDPVMFVFLWALGGLFILLSTVVVGSGTDETDGPSEVAGGIVDEQTLKRAREMGIDIDDALNRHDVTPVFEALKDAIHTGATGTNVNDLKLLLVS